MDMTLTTYTVLWKNYNGTTLERDDNAVYGATPVYNGTAPKRATDNNVYQFIGWSETMDGAVLETLPKVTKDTTYFAVFSSTPVIEAPLPYTDVSLKNLTEEQRAEVNALFYENSLTTNVVTADPTAIYCEEDGCYYMYGTYDTPEGTREIGLSCFRSKNFIDWENLDLAFYQPDCLTYDKVKHLMTEEEFADYQAKSWIKYGNIWAPSVTYDADTGLYYMYASAQTTPHGVFPSKYALFVAVSKHPAGPFIQWKGTIKAGVYENGVEYGARQIDYSTPLMNFENAKDTYGNVYADIDAIDADIFKDPVSGNKYLYFVGARGENMATNKIFGMKMIDWFTPDYSTLSLLAVPNYQNLAEETPTISDEGEINEAPCVVYNPDNGYYYMAFSAEKHLSKTYRVKQAISKSPLGPYQKIRKSKGGRILSCGEDWLHRAGTGHHTFINVGDEMFIVYPMHQDPLSESVTWKARVIGVDKVHWIENEDGLLVMKADGPSYDYRLRPSIFTGYRNVASQATITCSQARDGSSVKALTDKAAQMLTDQYDSDFHANKEPLVITLDFENPILLKGIMVTNSRDMALAFQIISKIEVEYSLDDRLYRVSTGEVLFDWARFYHRNATWNGVKTLIPGCGATAIFDEIQNVSRIKIYLEDQPDETATGLSVAEISIIGK